MTCKTAKEFYLRNMKDESILDSLKTINLMARVYKLMKMVPDMKALLPMDVGMELV